MRNFLSRFLIVILMLLMGWGISNAATLQGFQTIQEFPSNWIDIANPITVTLVAPTNKPAAVLTDDGVGFIPLPFDFTYDNVTYTAGSNLTAAVNGWLSIAPMTDDNNNLKIGTAGWNNIIAWCAEDLEVLSVDKISYATTGTAPLRVLTIQWKNVRYLGGLSTQDMNCQIKLYESLNNIEMIFGVMTGAGYQAADSSLCALIGAVSTTSYINFKPASASTIYRSWGIQNQGRWVNPTSGPSMSGKGYRFINMPDIIKVYPTNGSLLALGQVYGTTYPNSDQKPGVDISNMRNRNDVYVKYKITGPIASTSPQVIYIGHQLNNPSQENVKVDQSSANVVTVRMPSAKNIAAATNPNNGNLDLRVLGLEGGDYTVETFIEIRANATATPTYTSPTYTSTFSITYNYDIAAIGIIDPQPKETFQYPESSPVPLFFRAQNFGVNTATNYVTRAHIYRNNILDTIIEKTYNNNPAIAPMQAVTLYFPNYYPTGPGDYQIYYEIDLLNVADEQPSNNRWPRGTELFTFTVAYSVELEAVEIMSPLESHFLGRPINPKAKYRNNGINVANNAVATFEIYHAADTVLFQNPVYSEFLYIVDLAGNRFTTNQYFDTPWFPSEPGDYVAVTEISSDEDTVLYNNRITKLFHIVPGVCDTFTIGTTYPDSPRNYKSVEAALSDLYLKGLGCPVVFVMTDAIYEIGDSSVAAADKPALDMTSFFFGNNSTNTIKFIPSTERAASAESVQFKLKTNSGVGILFGQNDKPGNVNAIVNNVSNVYKKGFCNPPNGSYYITFDGGVNKSFLFTVVTSSDHRSPFYLSQGASDITIENCIIKDGIYQATSKAWQLPLAYYSSPQFVYERDNKGSGKTYSAGIVQRSRAPYDDPVYFSNLKKLDTLSNNNNTFINNEISGFAYGIVSLGTGPLYCGNKYNKYYNSNNVYNDNLLYNLYRAGIFLGNESSGAIKHNRIYNIKTGNIKDLTYRAEIAGIMLGGESTPAQGASPAISGYNNDNIVLDGNEISEIGANSAVNFHNFYGIKVEQCRNSYPLGANYYYLPDVDDNFTVINNMIWNINTPNGTSSRFGIFLSSERTKTGDPIGTLTTPKDKSYKIKNSRVANNTILFREDGVSNISCQVGIGVAQATGTVVLNNAIAILDTLVSNPFMATCAFYQGAIPDGITYNSNYNVFHTSSASTVYRFIETDQNENIVEGYDKKYNNDYKTIVQWRSWTGQDISSVAGPFANDMTITGIAPKEKLRVNAEGALGLVLNNRGTNLSWVPVDIDGNTRGTAYQKYDVGACEFEGRMYQRNAEVVSIVAPATYRSGSAPFNTAEHFMTTSPIDITARFRNSGLLDLRNIEVNAKIYREKPDVAGEFMDTPIIDVTHQIEIPSMTNVDHSFGLNAGSLQFNPNVFTDEALRDYTVPYIYSTMKGNVTPMYKVVISIASDINNGLNVVEKTLRFYIKRSEYNTIVTVENSFDNTNASANLIAGRINADSLKSAMREMQWVVTSEDPTKKMIDLFDRAGWELKTVNYTFYRNLIWSDGDDRELDRYEIKDLNNFVNSSSISNVKNMIISSQDMARKNRTKNYDFVHKILYSGAAKATIGTTNYTIDNPWSVPNSTNNGFILNISNDSTGFGTNNFRGVGIGDPSVPLTIKTTGAIGDPSPYCSEMTFPPDSVINGQVMKAYNWGNTPRRYTVGNPDTAMGIAYSTVTRNVVYLGVDWRHYGQPYMVLRGCIDFFDKQRNPIHNELHPFVPPVELYTFDAYKRNNNVEVVWTTVSEYETLKFEVERAEKSQTGISQFASIQEVKAAGNSTQTLNYGPFVDRNLTSGTTYVYRLKIVDLDGTFNYSNEVEVAINSQDEVSISKVWPNPTVDMLNIQYNIPKNSNAEMLLIDVNGNTIRTIQNADLVNASGLGSVSVADLAQGVYRLVLKAAGKSFTTQINIVK